jgi:hypothetical protein
MIQLPILDDRGFEQVLAEAKRRIAVHTPEWTNFEGESDPGITFVELFAFIADNVIYRANRVPELNRLKFLQLMGLRLRPANAARGVIVVRNERGPVEARPFDRGLVVSAGKVDFVTRDGVTVLPVEGRAYWKQPLASDDPRLAQLQGQHEAVRIAMTAAGDEIDPEGPGAAEFTFYEPTPLTAPAAGAPEPVVDLAADTLDGSLYLALLAPQNVSPDDVRGAIANEVLSIGIAPVLAATVPPLLPAGSRSARQSAPRLVYEILDRPDAPAGGRWSRLPVVQDPDVLTEVGIVQLQLPEASRLRDGEVADPLLRGVDDLPPRIDDDRLRARVVTWIRMRLGVPSTTPAATGGAGGTGDSGDACPEDVTAPSTDGTSAAGTTAASASASASSSTTGSPTGAVSSTASAAARITWTGVNAARVIQAVPVAAELVGVGNGEPDQSFALAHGPVLPETLRLGVEGEAGLELWRQVDDLAGLPYEDRAFTLDPAAAMVTFGGPEGARPASGRRIFASYDYGGGLEGNVSIGAIKTSADPGVAGFVVENPLATSGGDLAETVVEAERTLPAVLRHRERLVSDQDFRDVTMRTPGVDVGRVEVLSLFRPDAPGTEAAGVVTVMVVPRFDGVRPRWPTPDRLFLRTVCDHLDPRRLVTTELYVRGPEYLDTWVTIGIVTAAGWFPDIVRQAVRNRMYEYLSSLPPGGAAFGGWELGRTILKKDLEAVATRVPGVSFVRSIRLAVGTGQDADAFSLSGLQLPLLRNFGVVEGEAEPLSAVIAGALTGPPPRQVPVPVSPEAC